jgi:crotonobetaine/carnitine-CoA ligase
MAGATYDGPLEISALIERQAAAHGSRLAITSRDGARSFAQLAEDAARVCGGLRSLGVEPGDRVATMLRSDLGYLGPWFGSAWAGAVEVPVNTDYKGEYLAHVLRQSESSVLFVDGAWLDRLRGLHLPHLRVAVVHGDRDYASPSGLSVVHYDDLITSPPAERTPREETDLAYVLYTSGTSGPSKGVMQSNRCVFVTNVLPWLSLLGISSDDVAYSMFPFFHGTGRTAIVTTMLHAGGRTVLRDRFSVREFWPSVHEAGATIFPYAGAVIGLLAAQPPAPDDRDNPLRVGLGGGAPQALIEEFEERFDLRLSEIYGSTELGAAVASPVGKRKRGTHGVAQSHVVVEIHDAAGRPAGSGVPGEIVARPTLPSGIFAGYWGDPEATVGAFRDLWFHSGDRGVMDDEGCITFIDRIKDSIRRRGENISGFEVERSVNAHDGVLESAAYAVPSALTEDEVMVAVVAHPGVAIDVEELFAFCIETMPRFAVPRYVRFVDKLPKNPSERIQKYILRAEGITEDTHDREALGFVLERG